MVSSMNLKLQYQYRDAGNYKNWGEVVFSNPNQRMVEEVHQLIADTLIDGEFFYSEDWGVPDLHFEEYPWDDDLDHDWHQFQALASTDEIATDNIEDFLSRPHPLRAEWNRITNAVSQ